MWKKTTAVLMICILCISFSFPVSNAAEISGTASDVTNYRYPVWYPIHGKAIILKR
mgnify:CR=1 FL=1